MQSKYKVLVWHKDEEALLKQYANLLSITFEQEISRDYLYWKHALNPLGQSIITYVLNDDGELIAARAFWRMWSDTHPVFQPCDTVTRKDYQGQGLFTQLTNKSLALIPDDAAVINFPNNNSLPGYLKLGWQVLSPNKKLFSMNFVPRKKLVNNLFRELDGLIDELKLTYLDWRFGCSPHAQYTMYISDDQLIIKNGRQFGSISLTDEGVKIRAPFGFSAGYCLTSNVAPLIHIFTGKFTMNCQSRTVYYLKGAASMDVILNVIDSTQINVLMDTF